MDDDVEEMRRRGDGRWKMGGRERERSFGQVTQKILLDIK